MGRLLYLAFLLAGICLGGCGGSAPTLQGLPGPDLEFQQAKKVFDKGDYIQAATLLSAFVDAHPGSNQLDQVLMMLGTAHQHTGENLLAVEDFDRLIRDFPQSPLREQADYERARSHLLEALGPALDPEETETALALLRSYLNRYPQGTYAQQAQAGVDDCLERLATKAYLNGITYLKLHRDAAAVIYLRKALATKDDFRDRAQVLAELARAELRLGFRDKAREAWQQLVDYATPERMHRNKKLPELRQEAEQTLRNLPLETGEGGGH